MWVLWLAIIILLSFLEVTTVNLVSVWFIASGLISLFLSFFINSFYLEFAVFVIVGLILMLITRPILLKKFNKTKEKTNVDRIIGMEGLVTEEINRSKIGEVKVDGKRWSAISKEKIPVGSPVIIEKIEGVKLLVRKGEE